MGPAPSKPSSKRLEDIAFNMKVASKTWEREANKMHAKCELAEKKVLKEVTEVFNFKQFWNFTKVLIRI